MASTEQHKIKASDRAGGGEFHLTPLRAKILGIVQHHKTPIGAYEIAEAISTQSGRRVFPATVYRVLDYLSQCGAIQRVETRNAYVAVNPGSSTSDVLFICNSCGNAAAVPDQNLEDAVTKDADNLGFTIEQKTLEVRGVCRDCRPTTLP